MESDLESDKDLDVADGIEVSAAVEKQDSPKKDRDSSEKQDSPLSDVPDSEVEPSKSVEVAKDDDTSSLSSVVIDDPPPTKKRKSKQKPPAAKKARTKGKPATAADDDGDSGSEMSVVLDEPPPKKKGKSAASAGKKGASTATKGRKAASAEDIDPDDAEIKKLQGQLVKCGVRKVWGNELKKFGDNKRDKIQHLRDMLRDAGLTGRFSEARAREIKQERELAQESAAAQEFSSLWGVNEKRGRRIAAPRKSLKEDIDDEEEEDGSALKEQKEDGSQSDGANDDDDDDEGPAQGNSRSRKRRQEWAKFLGDDSDSD